MQNTPDTQAQMIEQTAQVLGTTDGMLIVVFGAVAFIFSIMGALTYSKKKKSALSGFFLGLFTAGLLLMITLMVLGAVHHNTAPPVSAEESITTQ